MKSRIDLNLIQSRLKIKQLVVFNAVFQERSIMKAAEKLNVTQPAVTRTIRELEVLFDCNLFERNNRGVVPTVFGLSVGRYAQSLTTELRHTMDELNALKSGDEGHVIIGTLISAATQLLPNAIALLKQNHPRIVVTIREGTNDLLLPMLANGEIDIVLGRIPDSTRYFDVSHHTIYTEPLYAVVNKSHPALTSTSSLTLAALMDYHWVLPISESPVRYRVERLFEQAGLPLPEKIVESLSIATNLGLLNTINAIALIPGSVAKYYADSADYRILDDLELGEFGKVGYSLADARRPNPSTSLFIDCLLMIEKQNKT